MACRNSCKICEKLIISASVTFTDGNLIIGIPSGSYNDGSRYCIVAAQAIPVATTINAPVVVQIGDGTVLYPVINRNGTPVTACGIRTRRRYATVVRTTTDTGVFRLFENVCGGNIDNLRAINGEAVTADGGGDTPEGT